MEKKVELIKRKVELLDAERWRRLEMEYEQAFPEEERRDWSEIVSNTFQGEMYLIVMHGDICGFVTLWSLAEVDYIEHLLIVSEKRGQGIGQKVIEVIKMMASPRPILLESEPAYVSALAQRRLDFYIRMGFSLQAIDYVQPSYRAGGLSVPLNLLATVSFTTEELQQLKAKLYREVYAVASQDLVLLA